MVKILVNCLDDVLTSRNHQDLQPLAKQIEANALNAWQNRQPSETSTRFLQKLNDRMFRFLNVVQQPNGSLLVYR